MESIPLMDTTEARYGEIARKMATLGDWVTLQHSNGVPFLGKPPLSTWLAAASMSLLGITPFAARLPSLILSLIALWLMYDLIKRERGSRNGWLALVIIASSLLFFISAGSVMTDQTLIFSLILTQVAFWRAVIRQEKAWGWIFFISLGLGLLAKGLLPLALTAPVLLIWITQQKLWKSVPKRLPFLWGGLVGLLIAAPWFILAESRTPGFLHYFFIGEHFSRFLVSGWTGDRYGFAHAVPFGMIWLFALIALFPWSVLGIWSLIRERGFIKKTSLPQGWSLYWLLWAVFPLLFFTFSRNIIWTYALPSIPAIAILLADRFSLNMNKKVWIGSLVPVACCLIAIGISFKNPALLRTQKPVIDAWKANNPQAPLLYWKNKAEFSAEFYSNGKVITTHDEARFDKLCITSKELFVAIPHKSTIPPALQDKFEPISTIATGAGIYHLMKKKEPL